MRSPVAPPRGSRLRLHRIHHWLVLLLVVPASSWAQDVRLTPSLLIPNYDRVHPGLTEALEAGAFTARARNAPAGL